MPHVTMAQFSRRHGSVLTAMAQASPEWPRLLKGAELVARDMNGSSDPYAVLTVGHQTKTSKAAKP